MRAGKLDRRVIIQRFTLIQGKFNDTQVWSDHLTLWASKSHMTEDEIFASNQTIAKRALVFEIRFHKDVTETDRLLFDGETYNIVGVSEIGRAEGLRLKCELLK